MISSIEYCITMPIFGFAPCNFGEHSEFGVASCNLRRLPIFYFVRVLCVFSQCVWPVVATSNPSHLRRNVYSRRVYSVSLVSCSNNRNSDDDSELYVWRSCTHRGIDIFKKPTSCLCCCYTDGDCFRSNFAWQRAPNIPLICATCSAFETIHFNEIT